MCLGNLVEEALRAFALILAGSVCFLAVVSFVFTKSRLKAVRVFGFILAGILLGVLILLGIAFSLFLFSH
jgi:hypothetical protein